MTRAWLCAPLLLLACAGDGNDGALRAEGNAGAGGDTGAAAGDSSSVLDAPDEEGALLAFLDAKQYAGWAKELDYHESTGPHGDSVRVYYGPRAAEALRDGPTALPAGAASIKELASGGSVYGWAVWVKVQEASDEGDGFYWYELIRHEDGSESVYASSRGATGCVRCHASGVDYNLSTLPFE